MNLFSRTLLPGFLLLGLSSFSPALAAPKRPAPPAKAAAKSAPLKSAAPKGAASVWTLDSLPISALPQVPVEFEFVGTQRDLLGIIESAIGGAEVSLKVNGKTTETTLAKAVAGKNGLPADLNISDLLKDVHFVRAQSFNFLKMEAEQDAASAAKTPMGVGNFEKMMTLPESKRPDVQAFYAKQFRAGHGHRQFFSTSSESAPESNTSVTIWVFEAPRSWALVTQGPSRAIVILSDGLPRLEALASIFKEVTKK